jgi:nucleotide-binding universal stress UspA family protein
MGMTSTHACIVVGIDFSDASRRALDHAIPLCIKLNAELVLLHSWNPTGWVSESELTESAEDWLDAAKELALARLEVWGEYARRAGARVETRLEPGPASRSIIRVTEQHKPTLTVVGRRGRSRLAHVLLGSVSERVVRRAPCPVLVVPKGTVTSEPPERLLVGVDFSLASRDALDAAIRLAREFGARRGLVLVHVSPGEQELYLEGWSELVQRDKWRYDKKMLETWAARRSTAGVEMDARVVDGRSETALVEVAKNTDCDWIVVGAQGRTALAELLIGRTTDRVLKLADRPVLVVPATAASPGEDAS